MKNIALIIILLLWIDLIRTIIASYKSYKIRKNNFNFDNDSEYFICPVTLNSFHITKEDSERIDRFIKKENEKEENISKEILPF